jgi:hypothetical protein
MKTTETSITSQSWLVKTTKPVAYVGLGLLAVTGLGLFLLNRSLNKFVNEAFKDDIDWENLGDCTVVFDNSL